MKLWLILYFFGKVAATWGPLEYGWEECQNRVTEINASFDESFADPKKANDPQLVIKGKRLTRSDVRAVCELLPVRPELEID